VSETLEVTVARDERGALVRSSAVGIWRDPPAEGRPLVGGSPLGTLLRLNRCFTLLLPTGEQGIVGAGLPVDRIVPVEHGQTLFRLRELHGEDLGGVGAGVARAGMDAAEGLPEGSFALRTPTDGVFYRRPSAEAPPFVEVGGAVVEGQPIGLVEVMKTFHQIAYGGAGLPARGRVAEIRVEDGAEVCVGEILLIVR